MGFFDRRNKSIQSTGGWDTLAKAIQRVWTKPPMRDSGELPDLFHKNPRLSPVAAIARAVASTPYQLLDKIDYRQNKNSATPILDHEILDLLDAPIKRYPEIDGYFMFYTIEALTKLVGEAFLLKVRDDKGHVIELDIIPPAWVTQVPCMSSPWFIVYPYGTAAARALRVSPDDMITFRRPNLSDPYGRGRGDSEPLEQEFVADENMARMQSNFAYNDATPPYIISVPGLPPDQAEAFKQSWMQKIGGMGHRREPGILGFPAEVKTLAMSPVELDMIESRKFIRDMSSEHYQIPPEILGRIENSNRSTIDSAFYLYNKNVLCYEYGFIERTLTRQLIIPDFDKRLIFKFDPSIPEDEEHKLSVLNAGLQAGAVMLDEWRKAFDLPEVPNGKGKVFLRTFAQYEVPADGKEPELPPEKPSGQTEDKPTDDELLSPEDLGLDAESAKSFKIVDYSTEKVSIVSKYNENHDEMGRFTSGDGSGGNYGSDNENITASNVTASQAKDILSGNIEVPSGCYVHGREKGSGGFESDEWCREFTQDIDVANDYAGSNGNVYMVSPKDGTVVCDFSNPYSSDMNEFCEHLASIYEDKKDGEFADIITQIKLSKGIDEVTVDDFTDAVREEFTPQDIVDSARAYDSPEWTGLLEYAKGTSDSWAQFVIVPNGGAVLPPGSYDNVDHVNLTQLSNSEKCIKQLYGHKIYDARRTAIWKAFDARATAKEGEFIQAVKKYAEDQKKRVVSAINSSKLEDSIKSGGAYNAEVESILRTVFDDKANKALKSALAPAWLHSLESGRDHTYDMIYGNFGKSVKAPNIRPSMTVTNALFNEIIESVGLLKAEGINDTTNEKLRKQLQDAISDGIRNGDNLNTIKNSILDVCDGVYDEMSTSRAMLIGRTESASSVTSGTYLTGKAEGMTRKTWLSQIDERTRIDHIDVDGQTVGIDEPFIVGGCSMQYPLDPSCGDAGQICNCRCSITFEMD